MTRRELLNIIARAPIAIAVFDAAELLGPTPATAAPLSDKSIQTLMASSDGSAFTGDMKVFVSRDGGALKQGAGTITNHGLGLYHYQPTRDEIAGHTLMFGFGADGAIPSWLTLEVVNGNLSYF